MPDDERQSVEDAETAVIDAHVAELSDALIEKLADDLDDGKDEPD